jgi:hypothetical protein
LKLIINPKTEAVRSILTERLGKHESLFAKADEELKKITGSGLYTGTAANAQKFLMETNRDELRRLSDQLALLDSAASETTCVEIDLE